MALRAEFLKAVNAAVVLDALTGTPAVVKGLNSITLPIESRDAITFSVFGVDFQTQEVGEGKRSSAQFSGYLIIGDEDGQQALQEAMVAQTKLTDVRFYLDSITQHFVALDLIGDPGGFFQVSKAGPDGAAGKNDAFKYSGEMLCGGAIKTFGYHAVATDIAFAATGNKITSTTTDFVAAGFKVGRTLIVDGSAGNKGYAKITAVAEHEMTVSGVTLVLEASGPSIKLHASTY